MMKVFSPRITSNQFDDLCSCRIRSHILRNSSKIQEIESRLNTLSHELLKLSTSTTHESSSSFIPKDVLFKAQPSTSYSDQPLNLHQTVKESNISNTDFVLPALGILSQPDSDYSDFEFHDAEEAVKDPTIPALN